MSPILRSVLGAVAAAVLLGTFVAPANAQRTRSASTPQGAARPVAMSDSALLAELRPRALGPAVMSGRISDVAIPDGPRERAAGRLGKTIYAAAASGGVWKSTNGGTTWEPIFDEYGASSIGDVAVAPSNPEIVWVGTGEQNNLRSSSWGDGIYKSVNGGRTFTHMGLRTSQHIGRILVHPTNPDVVWVAAAGPLWGEGGERGVFRTTDGGRTWTGTLVIDRHTGVTDIAIDPSDPDVLYAAAYQRERKAYSFIGGGPESAIHKSTDGGETWRRVDDGLPETDMGRIGLDVCEADPRTVYAVVHAEEGGVFRSDNHGESWTRTSNTSSIPWFFGQIRVDPRDCDRVYFLGVQLQRSEDGGRTFQSIARQVHADQHAMWIDPTDSDHIVLGNDGGLYITYDRGQTWNFSENLPVSQFYAIGIDMREPFYYVYGGLQDNSTWGGPSRTRARTGIRNADWFRTSGGDGFYAAIDPVDPTIIYSESQNGGIVRFDARTGERKTIKPQPKPGEPAYRWNWSAPILISPHDPATIYFAANHLFRSPDRGDSWVRLGTDLTRHRNRDSIPMMGRVWGREGLARHEGTAEYGNISVIDESPLRKGLLYVGTDDGLIQVSEDGGATWRRIDRFPSVPDETYVSRVVASRHHEGTVYATFDGHRSNDFKPYVLKSTDYGRSWRPITANLPESGSTHVIREHHRNPDLLFVGTEFGVFFTVDGGGSWTRIRQGIPTAIVHDLIIHPRENDLIIGTHGRGIFIIDDITPLEQLATARRAQLAHLFPVRPATLMNYSDAVPGPRGSGAMADRGWSAPNPPPGASIAYYVSETYPRRRALSLSIVDGQGTTVRELQAPATPGIHRVQWDLRHAPAYTPPRAAQPGGGGQGGQGGGGAGGGAGGFGGGAAAGPYALPGEYIARLEIAGTGEDARPTVLEQPVIVRADPLVTLTLAQQEELFEVRMRASRMLGVAQMMLRNADQAKAQVTEARAALRQMANAPADVAREAAAIDRELDDVLRKVRGSGQQRGRGGDDDEEEDEERPGTPQQAVLQRLNGAAGQIGNVTSLPTEQQREMLSSAIADLEKEVERLNALLSRIPALQVAMDKAGAPWSVGRPVAWPDRP